MDLLKTTAVLGNDYCPICSNPPLTFMYHMGSPCPNQTATITISCSSNFEHNRIFKLPIVFENNKSTILLNSPQIICKDCSMKIEYGARYE